MQVTRTSIVSGVTRTLDLPITEDQVKAYKEGALIQNAFPNLSKSQREFIQTGMTDAEWNTIFPPKHE